MPGWVLESLKHVCAARGASPAGRKWNRTDHAACHHEAPAAGARAQASMRRQHGMTFNNGHNDPRDDFPRVECPPQGTRTTRGLHCHLHLLTQLQPCLARHAHLQTPPANTSQMCAVIPYMTALVTSPRLPLHVCFPSKPQVRLSASRNPRHVTHSPQSTYKLTL